VVPQVIFVNTYRIRDALSPVEQHQESSAPSAATTPDAPLQAAETTQMTTQQARSFTTSARATRNG
jgi:hypothetical protein